MLRRFAPLLAATLVLAACDRSPVESAPAEEVSFEAVLETSGEGVSAGAFLERAPESLRLTAEQRTALRDINAAFRAANQADFEALRVIVREAVTARKGGASPADVRAILERSRPIRERLRPAFAALREAVNGVLTEAQRAWLRENARRLGPLLPQLPPRP